MPLWEEMYLKEWDSHGQGAEDLVLVLDWTVIVPMSIRNT